MFLKKLRNARKGATAVEYAIIASLLSVVIIVGVEATGVATEENYNLAGQQLEGVFQPASGGSNTTIEKPINTSTPISPNLRSNPDLP